VPQRDGFYEEQGNTVSGEENVYNYKSLISMPIFYLVTLINSFKASSPPNLFSAAGNEDRFVLLWLKY